jgi:hypothetical protein
MDFLGLAKQATQLQAKMEALQAELDSIEVEGTAGGDLVKVRLTAKGELKGLSVDASLWKADEREHSAQRTKGRERRGSDRRRPRGRAAQGRGFAPGKDEATHRRPAAAARTQVVLSPQQPFRCPPLPDRKSSA